GLYLGGDQPVEADLVADHVAEPDAAQAEHDGPAAGGEVAWLEADKRGDVRQQPAERNVFAERHQLSFDIERAGATRWGPELTGVALRMLEHLPGQHRAADRVDRAGDLGVDRRIQPRVQVGGVLRP